jgi:hypothetical protein
MENVLGNFLKTIIPTLYVSKDNNQFTEIMKEINDNRRAAKMLLWLIKVGHKPTIEHSKYVLENGPLALYSILSQQITIQECYPGLL